MVGASTSPLAGDGGGSDGGSGPNEVLILLVFTILTVAASAFFLHRAADKALHDPVQKAARGEIQGLDELSFLRPENFRKALAKVSASRWPMVISIRLAAARVDVTVRDKDGYRKYLSIDPSLKVDVSDDNVGEDKAVAVSQIDVNTPQRMIRAVTERTHMSADAIDYLVTDADNDKDTAWYMFLDKGPARVRQWVATRDGSDLRHPGEPSQAQKDATAKQQREFKAQQRRSERRVNCLSKAFTASAVRRCDRKFP
jgi:hypothetical protein